MSATPRSGEGHDIGPDGCDPRHAIGGGTDGAVAAQTPPALYRRVLTTRSRRITVALTVAFCYVLADILVEGPLTMLDEAFLRWHHGETVPALHDWAWAYDKMGQRSVLLPILLVVAGFLARRHRTWRPGVLALAAFVILNVVVGAMKVLIGRSETETGDPSVFNHGIIFPSGHSSNMVLTGGMIAYLLIRYVERPPVKRFLLGWSVLTALTIATSLYLGTHWISDLLGGVLVGGLLLQAVIAFDRKTAHVRDDPPAIVAAAIRLIEPDPPQETEGTAGPQRLGGAAGDGARVAAAVPDGRRPVKRSATR
ncbi:MAG: hypothetical protein QOI54_1185 [Actinomycetota bacterium]|nr:hypothetical protein [Actinomycetota bacterium]